MNAPVLILVKRLNYAFAQSLCHIGQSFAEIVAELKRYYNVDVRFMDDALRSERFSGDFRVEDGIYHIMSVLQLTYKFTYKVVGNDIEIYPNPKR